MQADNVPGAEALTALKARPDRLRASLGLARPALLVVAVSAIGGIMLAHVAS